jgi:hypothetical protein
MFRNVIQAFGNSPAEVWEQINIKIASSGDWLHDKQMFVNQINVHVLPTCASYHVASEVPPIDIIRMNQKMKEDQKIHFESEKHKEEIDNLRAIITGEENVYVQIFPKTDFGSFNLEKTVCVFEDGRFYLFKSLSRLDSGTSLYMLLHLFQNIYTTLLSDLKKSTGKNILKGGLIIKSEYCYTKNDETLQRILKMSEELPRAKRLLTNSHPDIKLAMKQAKK